MTGGDPTQLTAETIGAVPEQVAEGTFAFEIDAAHPFAELDLALARSEAGHLRGKLLVTGPRHDRPRPGPQPATACPGRA